jgi:tetratricopeptide (TPR) repeat protein
MLASAAYFQKNELARGAQLLEAEASRNPTNDTLLIKIVQIFVTRGMFSNAQTVTENRLRLSPDDPDWLLTKGYLDNQLKQYDDALIALNRVLAIEKDNVTALLGRANAYLGAGNLSAARADYGKVLQSNTTFAPALYGMGEIAWRQHDTNQAVGYYENYLHNAPTNTAEAQTAIGRLHDLKQPASGK